MKSLSFYLGILLVASFLGGCATSSDEEDPNRAAQYKTKDERLRTRPWAAQEKWEKGGALGAYQDPRYRN